MRLAARGRGVVAFTEPGLGTVRVVFFGWRLSWGTPDRVRFSVRAGVQVGSRAGGLGRALESVPRPRSPRDGTKTTDEANRKLRNESGTEKQP
jgi:hypothetical protein